MGEDTTSWLSGLDTRLRLPVRENPGLGGVLSRGWEFPLANTVPSSRWGVG